MEETSKEETVFLFFVFSCTFFFLEQHRNDREGQSHEAHLGECPGVAVVATSCLETVLEDELVLLGRKASVFAVADLCVCAGG